MLKYMLITLILLSTVLLSAMVVETGSLKGFIYGSEPAAEYDNWISHLAEKITSAGYNVYSPWDRQTAGFGDFHIPVNDNISNWNTIIDEFLLQNWANVDNLLTTSGFPYHLVQFLDTDTNRTYYMLREVLIDAWDDNGTLDTYDDEEGAFGWGWGLYIYNPAGDQRTIITIPHPCDDFMTPTLGTIAFQAWNAQFMLMNGAGREVQWTNQAPYTNSKSLSDPTRTSNHPWYPAYTKFCNQIRDITGKREFSAQLHSYDTDLHTGFSSVQISVGYNKMCPNLPVRDLSRFKHDLINQGNYVMIPANTIGSNDDVLVNDYYTVQYSIHPFTFEDDNITEPVNNVLDLGAYSQNVQMNYTLSGWTDYDIYDPFFHAEMDELPRGFLQNDITYNWFYGWNTFTQRWNMEHLFDNAIQYYSYWINDMSIVLTETLNMNDNLTPLPPSGLVAFNQSYDYITLQWQKADDYDFDTYEILYSTQPIGSGHANTFNRINNTYLASPYCEQINVTGLSNGTLYYFAIRAKDKNGNTSPISNEISATTSPANITNFTAVGLDDSVYLKWNVANQNNNQGFSIYRKINDSAYILQDSYLTNTNLLPGNTFYQWYDTNVVNNEAYIYRISAMDNNNTEFFHNLTFAGYPRDYYTLYVGTEDNAVVDSLCFSANPGATSGYNSDYDLVKPNAPIANYVYGGFWEQYWGSNGTLLQQEVMDDFDPDTNVKGWSIRVKSDLLSTPLVFRIDDSFTRYSEKLYLRDNATGSMTDLEAGNYTFSVTNTNNRSFTLYWGNLQPAISISNLPNRVYQGGTLQPFYWSANYGFLVNHYNLSFQNGIDSILVAENLPNTYTSFSVTFPTDVTMENAKFVVDSWSNDGQLVRQTSAYTFGIVPSGTTYSVAPGLHMQANAMPNSVLTVPVVFGTGATGWTMDSNSNWWDISPFNFGLGYWIDKTNPFEYLSSAPIQKDSISITLRRNWNIIPNPHICTHNIKDLRFRISGVVYTFAEMIDQKLISRGIYVYRDGRYVQTDVIYPKESFLLKFYGATQMNASINFIPYYNGPAIQPISSDWELKLTAQQDNSDTDELIIGCNSLSTDNFDFKYDLPEPPEKPINNLTRLYTTRTHADSLFLDLQMNSEFQSPLNNLPEEERVWNFRMEVGNVNPVNFTVDSSMFPDNYGAEIQIGDFHYNIQHGDNFTYLPVQAGFYNGQIIIHNYFTSNEDETVPLLYNVKVYPNPFNPKTCIAFDMNKSERVTVDIYNIKGQKVKALHNGLLGKGTHQLIWDGKDDNNKNTGTGVYLAKINVNGKNHIQKMMLMK